MKKTKKLALQKIKPEKLQSRFYPLLKIATIIVFILVIVVAGVLLYAINNYFGLDLSNQVTAAATAAGNITP